MTAEQKKIQHTIEMFKGDEDYRDFKTAEEYLEFKMNDMNKKREVALEKNKDAIYQVIRLKSVDVKKWIAAFDTYSFWLDSDSKKAYEFYVELFSKKEIPAEVQFPLLIHLYVHCPVDKGFDKYLLEAYDNYPVKKKEKLHRNINAELEEYADEDGCLTVFRGEYMEAEFGSSIEISQAISFTIDYKKALFFACRWSPRKANIYTAKVAFEDIMYYTNDRGEGEVIIRPESKGGKLHDIKCEAVNPEDYYIGKTALANEARLRMAIENGIAVEDYMKMHPEYFKIN